METSAGKWGVLGTMELLRQELLDRHPNGLTFTQIMKLCDITRGRMTTFLMQMTRYCYFYEETQPTTTGGRHPLVFYCDPEHDAVFERRILPYDLASKTL